MDAELIQIGINQKTFPQYIFKYRPGNNDHTENIITKNELWFSNPLLFNDPYDCNIPIDVDTSLADIENWLVSVGVAEKSIEDLAKKLKENPYLVIEKTKEEMKHLGVCCFSTLDNSILQWSHYSNYHKGICLKFDMSLDKIFFMIPVIVSYRQVMQHYNHFIHKDEIVDYLIKPKFYLWSYESEIRIIKILKNKDDNRVFKYKDEALREVIFGTNTECDIIKKYKELCANNNKSHVRFYKMELGTGVHYELIKKPI